MDKTATPDRPWARKLGAPRGAGRTSKGWGQEAALRMLMNCLDPEIAENPQDLVVCGGSVRAAKDWASFDAIACSLGELESGQTLLVEAGKPAGIFPTQESSPRVLLTGDGAGSWTYIGTQEILDETYEIFAAAGKKHFGGDLAGKLIVTGGMGRTGGLEPLAATMNGAAILCVEVDPERIKKWMKRGSGEVMVNSLDEALRILKNAVRKREAASVGLVGNCADVIPELARRGVVPDLLTDQCAARDPLNGYVPSGLTMEQAAELRERDPQEYRQRAMESIVRHVEGMLALAKLGSTAFEYGNGIRAIACEAGVKNAYDFPGFADAYIRPILADGRRPLRYVALSGEPEEIRRIDRLALDMFGEDEIFSRWIRLAGKQVRFQGLPARACWLGRAERVRLGVAINDLVARAELKAPVVIAGEDFNPVSTALPSREAEREAVHGGNVAASDGKLLNSLLEAASGASWAWFQKGGEIGQWQRSGYAIVADGTQEMGGRIERLLTSDSGLAMA